MSYVEIEVRAKTVDLAVEAAMQELGVQDRDNLAIEVVSEPQKGFLGMGGQDAVVRVKPKPSSSKSRKRSRSRSKSSRSSRQNSSQSTNNDRAQNDDNRGRRGGKPQDKGRTMTGQEQRAKKEDDRPVVGLEDQARIAKEFLEGLVSAFGLEGTVETSLDDDVIVVVSRNHHSEVRRRFAGVESKAKRSMLPCGHHY